jgi:hypothetical protein
MWGSPPSVVAKDAAEGGDLCVAMVQKTVLLFRRDPWTSYHLSIPRKRFLPLHKPCVSTAGIIERVVAQHGYQHA